MFEGRLFITQMENTDRKCLTLEKRRDLRKWLCLGILGFGILEEKMPELSDAIDFDPEGSMFCAYSSKVDALARFALRLKEFVMIPTP